MKTPGPDGTTHDRVMTRRYLTHDLPGIGGRIKVHAGDFQVEELPLYAPSGEGEHTFFEIQKTGLSTFQAVRIIASALSIPPIRIGYAGLKDRQAITTQVLSVQGIPPDEVTALDLSGIRIMWAERHQNRLKIGHLRGNRFTIRVRGVDESAIAPCQEILDVLIRRGVPNRFGSQRFGLRGDSATLGRAIVRQDAEGFVKAFLGQPSERESAAVQQARAHFDAQRWAGALALLPGGMVDERRALETLIRTGGDYWRAYASLPKRLKRFLLSAYQSALFNRVLDSRLKTLDRVYTGDLAVKHPGSSIFRVEDEGAEQTRVKRFEISPTGPIYGFRMMQAMGVQGQLEAQVLADEELTIEQFRLGGGLRARGERRALRFPIHEPQVWYNEGVMLHFWLPRGCYATTVLSEIMKTQDQDVMEITEL